MLACMEGHLNVAEFLLQQGADMTVINKVGCHSTLTLFIKQRCISELA